MENAICWADIPVVDLDRAIAFYSAVLGAPVEKKASLGSTFGMLPHEGRSVSGCLVSETEENRPSATGPLVYLNVEGRLDAALAGVLEHGGRIVSAKEQIGPYGFRAILLDSEGNRIALHSLT